MKIFCIFHLAAQPVEQRLSIRKIVGSIPTLVIVVFCPKVGPIQSMRSNALYPLIDYSTAIDSAINHS